MVGEKQKIVAIIQARMAATRMPDKVLMAIGDKPMLWHVADRVGRCEFINKVVVATSINKKDDVIVDFCGKYNIDFYRGSEEDVLDRYYQAAMAFEADVIVRICADSPLLDPGLVDRMISKYLKNRAELEGVCTNIRRTFPIGLCGEVISFAALRQAWAEAQENYQRENVTAYLREHPEKFRLYNLENDKDLSHLRWTVDEEADLEFVREIYKRLHRPGRHFLMEDILKVLEAEPDLKKINMHITQRVPYAEINK